MHTFPLDEYMRHTDASRWEDAGRLLLESAQKLVGAGAELLICPDNTLHQALDLVHHQAPAPWLHIAEEVSALAAARRFKRLGILGTRSLMEGPVYRSKLSALGIEGEIPGSKEREGINAIIFDELVYGRFEDRARHYFREVIRELAERGCDAVVLGCTEIPLLISDADSPLPVLDSTRILARAALREATRALPA
jgi:aspartate racemase